MSWWSDKEKVDEYERFDSCSAGNCDAAALAWADAEYIEPEEKEVLERLAHYEDLEHAGRLKIFPCAIGDTIWIPLKNMGRFTGEIVEDKIQMIGFTSKGIRIKARNHHAHNITLKLGESVFLTREAAEAALKECEQE